MNKNIKPYKQRKDTCAIACLMMVLEYYHLIEKANWYDEKRFYKIYKSKYMDGTPFAALAFHFSKKRLETSIYHSENNLFSNEKGLLDDESFNLAMSEYNEILRRAKSNGTKVTNGINITTNLLKEKIEEGNLIILAGELSGIFHAILLSGYENDKFIVCDPLYKDKQIRTNDEINIFMNTAIGKWFISVNNKTLHKNNLLDDLN